jgi:hypothetical protein
VIENVELRHEQMSRPLFLIGAGGVDKLDRASDISGVMKAAILRMCMAMSMRNLRKATMPIAV